MTLPKETGLYRGVSREDYDRIQRVNFSTLKHMKQSPFHFRAATQSTFKDSDAMRIGRATHVMALEPETFFSRFAVWDGGTRRGKEWDKFCEKTEGLERLTEEQFHQVKAISAAALANEHAGRHLRGGAAEVTMLWTDPDTGVECKGRVDHAQDGGALVDLKTTRDASPGAFAKQCWNLSYCAQADFYRRGYEAASGKALPYIIVAVESASPHAVAVYRVSDTLLAMGREQNRDSLERLLICRKENHWPAYGDGEMELELPAWMQDREDVSGLGLEFDEEQPAHA